MALEEARNKAQEELETRKDGASNKIMPTYKINERLMIDVEDSMPPKDVFMPVGYNRVPKDGLKHYRKFYTDELENVKEVMPNKPFLEEQILRMKQESGGLFGGSNDSSDNVSVPAGKFKGLVKVYRKELRDQRFAKIEEGFNMLETSINDAYEAQINEKMDFDWDLLNDEKNTECYA